MAGLTVSFTCMNSMRTLPAALHSVRGLAERIIVVDSGSTDGTLECCAEHQAQVIHRDWTNMADQRGFSLEAAGPGGWVLSLDSDESLDQRAADSIRQALGTVPDSIDGLELNRMTLLDGRLLEHTFQPEWRLRLVRCGRATVVGDAVGGHDRIVVEGGVQRLEGSIIHDSWDGASDMLQRGVRYGFRAAGTARSGGRAINLLVNPAAAFLKQLVLRRGFRDGWRGWVAAGGVASQALAKHLAIMERRQRRREDDRSS